jgi:hypothetical protein
MTKITKKDRLLYEALKRADWNHHAIPDEALAEAGLTRQEVVDRLNSSDFDWAGIPAESWRRYLDEEIAGEHGVSAEHLRETRRRGWGGGGEGR